MTASSTTAVGTFSFMPSGSDFGTVQVGQSSAKTVFVSPVPYQPGDPGRTIDSIVGCTDFAVNTPGLPALVYYSLDCSMCATTCNNECEEITAFGYAFTVTFQPTVAGMVSCPVSLMYKLGASVDMPATVTLTGTGQALPQVIDVEPPSIAFGDVRRGSSDSGTSTVTVRSAGSAALAVSSVTASAGFVIVSGPTTSYSLATGVSQPYGVVCRPSVAGPMTGQLTVNSNDPAHPTVSIALSCNVIDSNLNITPSPVPLGTPRVGEPATATINLQNTGTASMTLQSVTVSGAGFTLTSSPSAGTMLAAGTGIAHAAVRFDAATKGNASAMLTVTYDDAQTRTTPITARALGTSMAVTPDGDIDFGTVCIGKSKQQQFGVLANDEGAFVLEGIAVDAGSAFTSSGTLPATVPGSGANQVSFAITAAPTAPGQATAMAALTTDIPGADPHVLSLAVQGLPAGVTATPAALDFGTNGLEVSTTAQAIHLVNCGDGPLSLSNARLEGPDAGDFVLVEQPASATLSLGSTADWLVVMQAHTKGNKQASFAVDYDGGSASIPLSGQGVSSADPGSDAGPAGPGSGLPGDKRASYYACSTASPTALWPMTIAIALALRRRGRRVRRSGPP